MYRWYLGVAYVCLLVPLLLGCVVSCKLGAEERPLRGEVVERVYVETENHVIITIDPYRSGHGSYTKVVSRATTCDVREVYPDCLSGK